MANPLRRALDHGKDGGSQQGRHRLPMNARRGMCPACRSSRLFAAQKSESTAGRRSIAQLRVTANQSRRAPRHIRGRGVDNLEYNQRKIGGELADMRGIARCSSVLGFAATPKPEAWPSLRERHGRSERRKGFERARAPMPSGTGWREACLRGDACGPDGQAATRVKLFRPWGQRK